MGIPDWFALTFGLPIYVILYEQGRSQHVFIGVK